MWRITVPYNNAEYEIDVTYFYAGKDAVTHLLPENCTPAEDSEIEFFWESTKIIEPDYYEYIDIQEDEEFYELAIKTFINQQIEEAADEY